MGMLARVEPLMTAGMSAHTLTHKTHTFECVISVPRHAECTAFVLYFA